MAETERARKWRLTHPERERAHVTKYRAENGDAIRAQKQEYYQRVRKAADKTEDGRLRDRNRKALRRAMIDGIHVTTEEWEEIKRAHDYRCAYCPSFGPLEMDHVVPLSKGGIHHKSNIVPACKPCNSRKGARCG